MREWINIVEASGKNVPRRLYHGTDILSMANILLENTFNGEQLDDTDRGPYGVSLTMDENVAIAFAEMREARQTSLVWSYEFAQVAGGGRGAAFELDGEALAARYRMRRIRNSTDEAEIRVLGDITPLSDFVTAIRCSRSDIDATIAMLDTVQPESLWVDIAPQWKAVLERLKADPRLRT
jgi:hypothetical protein